MTTQTRDVAAPVLPPEEWWQRWADRRAAWWAARPALAVRAGRVRAIALWAAIVWVGALLLWLPEVRLSVRAYLGCLWVVVVWFVLARTKSLTWPGYMRFFAACIPWSAAIGVVSTLLAVRTGLDVRSAGPAMAIAALTEEGLKLLPVALVAAAAPRRASRFATVDWLLLGMASGTAFTLVEEMLRRLNLSTATGFGALDRLMAQALGDGLPEGWVRFGLTLQPSEGTWNGAVYAGHGAITALVAGCAGLGVALWRSCSRQATVQRLLLRAAAVVLPVGALWLAVADHAGRNAQSYTGPVDEAGVPAWLDPAVSTVPWWMRVPWSLLGHGHGRMWLLALVLLAAVLVDGYRLVVRPASDLAGDQAPRWVWGIPRALGAATRSWSAPFARSLVSVAVAIVGLVWIVPRDLAQVVAAHARRDGEPRSAAVRRGGVVVSGQRLTRELTYEAVAGIPTSRRARGVAAAASIVLLGLAVVIAPIVAAQIGPGTSETAAWLAGQLDGLGDWWGGLNTVQQLGVGVAIAGLITLSGGSLGLAFGVSGVATYGLSHAHGAATFVRDPAGATSDYLATTTPADALVDAGEFVLTFAPTNFAGAAAGRGIRLAAEELARDPDAFIAARRLALADDAGVVDFQAFRNHERLMTALGTPTRPLDAAGQATAAARVDALPAGPNKARGAAAEYQAAVFTDTERLVDVPGHAKPLSVDGFTTQYGLRPGDAKFVGTSGSTFHIPHSLNDTGLQAQALKKLDLEITKLAEINRAVGGEGIEIVTNNPVYAHLVEERMRALGIDGWARLHPGGS